MQELREAVRAILSEFASVEEVSAFLHSEAGRAMIETLWVRDFLDGVRELQDFDEEDWADLRNTIVAVYSRLRSTTPGRKQGSQSPLSDMEKDTSREYVYHHCARPQPIPLEWLTEKEQSELMRFHAFLEKRARMQITRYAQECLNWELPLNSEKRLAFIRFLQTEPYTQYERLPIDALEWNFGDRETEKYGVQYTSAEPPTLPLIVIDEDSCELWLFSAHGGTPLGTFILSLGEILLQLQLWNWEELCDFALYGEPLLPRAGIWHFSHAHMQRTPTLHLHVLPCLSELTLAGIYKRLTQRVHRKCRLTAQNLAIVNMLDEFRSANCPKQNLQRWNEVVPPEWQFRGSRAQEMLSQAVRRVQQKWESIYTAPFIPIDW